ncbi:MAG: hypothetical protein P8179_21795 [Candidatus Thiodiazotropha sp.]
MHKCREQMDVQARPLPCPPQAHSSGRPTDLFRLMDRSKKSVSSSRLLGTIFPLQSQSGFTLTLTML